VPRLSVVAVTALSAASLAFALAPTAAPAKGRVTATVQAPTRCDAAAGTRVRIAFTLSALRADGQTAEPFGAGGVFVVLRRGEGRTALKRAARSGARGHYTARVTVPRGGIRRIDVGLEGTRTSGGQTHDADVLFRVVGDPCRAAR
jgi:hypothetical protein